MDDPEELRQSSLRAKGRTYWLNYMVDHQEDTPVSARPWTRSHEATYLFQARNDIQK
jgi:hypothetical protein